MHQKVATLPFLPFPFCLGGLLILERMHLFGHLGVGPEKIAAYHLISKPLDLTLLPRVTSSETTSSWREHFIFQRSFGSFW
jgi:hypothetical protein